MQRSSFQNSVFILVNLMVILEVSSLIIYFINIENSFQLDFYDIRKYDLDFISYVIDKEDDEDMEELIQFEKIIKDKAQTNLNRRNVMIKEKKASINAYESIIFCF